MGRLQDFVTDADLDGKWWWRLRRSFAIPDLASHETAFVAITEEIGQQVHGTPDYLPEVVAEASVVAFLRAGKAGDLEDIFVTNPHAAERVAPSDKAVGPASRITQSAEGDWWCPWPPKRGQRHSVGERRRDHRAPFH